MNFQSKGPLHYSDEDYNYKLIVVVDPEIARYARALVPKAWYPNIPRYAPHISVIRRENPVNMENWGKHEGEIITFDYDPEARFGNEYIWLRVFCPKLADIRQELGLPRDRDITRPPGADPVFHTTIANLK